MSAVARPADGELILHTPVNVAVFIKQTAISFIFPLAKLYNISLLHSKIANLWNFRSFARIVEDVVAFHNLHSFTVIMVNRPGKPGQNRNEFSPFVRFEKKTWAVASFYLLKQEIVH